jgi:hypothetical protein
MTSIAGFRFFGFMDLLVQGMFSRGKAVALRKLARKVVKTKGETYF